jgi:hypothetical protein
MQASFRSSGLMHSFAAWQRGVERKLNDSNRRRWKYQSSIPNYSRMLLTSLTQRHRIVLSHDANLNITTSERADGMIRKKSGEKSFLSLLKTTRGSDMNLSDFSLHLIHLIFISRLASPLFPLLQPAARVVCLLNFL